MADVTQRRPRGGALQVSKRLELTERQWEAVSPFLPGKLGDPGRHAADNRSFVNAVLWVLRNGCEWNHLPAHFGQYKSAHKRYRRWEVNGVWAKVLACLNHDLDTGLPVEAKLRAKVHKGDNRSVFDLS